MRLIARLGRPGKAALLIAVGAAGGGVALAVASVPSPDGVIHACYPVTTVQGAGGASVVPAQTATLRVIDPAATQSCNTSPGAGQERELSWNRGGPSGPTGATGALGATGAAGAPGQTITISGNSFTVSLPVFTPQNAMIGGLVVHAGGQVYRSKILSAVAAPRDIATGQSSGKRQHKPFVIVKNVDSATPVLFQAASDQTPLDRVTLFLNLSKPGASPQRYLVYHLTLVTVVHDTLTSGGAQKANEVEEIEITFHGITHEIKTTFPSDWGG